MKKTSLFILIVLAFLSGCATPTAETPQLLAPTDTIPPIPTDMPTSTDVPTIVASPTPTEEPSPTTAVLPSWLALIGQDGNVRLIDRISGQSLELTTDATQPGVSGGGSTTYYYSPQWSSDGQLLAYQREVGQPVASGYNYSFEVWVYSLATGENHPLPVEQRVVGASWRPGTHQLAISFALEEGYFSARGQIDLTKLKGIWAIDADTGELIELVQPQNGYSLGRQRWSVGGRYLFFEEIWNYEGSGYFTYYDFEIGTYVANGEIIGFSDLSPDNQTLVYDTLTYAPRGDERIFLRSLAGSETRMFSPDFEQGYAFSPRFSPAGDQIAYFANLDNPDNGPFTLFVQALDSSEPRALGQFVNGLYLNWLPDSSGLILSAGSYEARQIFEVSLEDGAARLITDGDAPALQPSNP